MLLLRPLSETGIPGCEDVDGTTGGDVGCAIVQGSFADGCAVWTVGLPKPNASFAFPFPVFPSFPSPNVVFSCFTTRTPIFAPVLSSIAASFARTSGLIGGVDDVAGEISCVGWRGVAVGALE